MICAIEKSRRKGVVEVGITNLLASVWRWLDPKDLNELGRQSEKILDYRTYVSEASGSFSGLGSKIKM
ncbi:MAG: hypothetical protein LKG19_06400 [Saprospiraceae bacterium]|jgi:hypothetical protein|nr:hypothetical protein [Saprospiraceae bacterium]